MNAITKFDMTPRQIALVKSTVARDTNDDEFNLYMEVAKAKGLDPFLGQIIPMVFNKTQPAKRKMTIIISRDGQRAIGRRGRTNRIGFGSMESAFGAGMWTSLRCRS